MSPLILPRRQFLLGLGATLLAAPAIVKASNLMPIRALTETMDVPVPDVFVSPRVIRFYRCMFDPGEILYSDLLKLPHRMSGDRMIIANQHIVSSYSPKE